MKKLVIYFSHTGENYMSDGIRNIDKGNTVIVAEAIFNLTKVDLWKVEPTKDSWFSHIAVEVPGENTSNEWLEPVTDEEYMKLN